VGIFARRIFSFFRSLCFKSIYSISIRSILWYREPSHHERRLHSNLMFLTSFFSSSGDEGYVWGANMRAFDIVLLAIVFISFINQVQTIWTIMSDSTQTDNLFSLLRQRLADIIGLILFISVIVIRGLWWAEQKIVRKCDFTSNEYINMQYLAELKTWEISMWGYLVILYSLNILRLVFILPTIGPTVQGKGGSITP
jgi:hypothetical protein